MTIHTASRICSHARRRGFVAARRSPTTVRDAGDRISARWLRRRADPRGGLISERPRRGGLFENRNVAFELRWADGQFDRLPGLAADLAGRKVAVIAAFGNASSLNRPGGNVTGVSILNQELESTRLERLVEVVPDATIIAFLVNPESLTADPKLREMENTARMFNRHLQVLNARNESEFEQVFVTVEQQRIGAMVVTSDTMFSNESATLGRVSARHTGAYDGSLSRFHERRRVDELRQRLGRCLSSRGSLRGANSQRRSAARSAGYAIHQSQVCHQYENR
jgi:hypothetical protein